MLSSRCFSIVILSDIDFPLAQNRKLKKKRNKKGTYISYLARSRNHQFLRLFSFIWRKYEDHIHLGAKTVLLSKTQKRTEMNATVCLLESFIANLVFSSKDQLLVFCEIGYCHNLPKLRPGVKMMFIRSFGVSLGIWISSRFIWSKRTRALMA